MSATTDPLAKCLGCGATFDSVRALRRGDAHAEGCEHPGEVFR
jgi:hypothetical protein